ncbi:MAG: rhodanese-like domain-containing protein [Verrucomicrobiota bacterium]
MEHSPGFLKLVNDKRRFVNEISVAEARAIITRNPKAVLMDVREDHEWDKGHAVEAVHLGKGIIERDIEKAVPDKQSEIILYCGGGFRSALCCEVLQEMGYKKVYSVIGGCRAIIDAGWKMQ